MATVLPGGLSIKAYLPREDVRDAYISKDGKLFHDLPQGATVGTASLRRQSLIRMLRPDIHVKLLRGNVETRLEKLRLGFVDATLLGYAGLLRLERESCVHEVLSHEAFPPAVGQGAIALQLRTCDTQMAELLQPLNCPETFQTLTCERAFLHALDGSCRTPIAGYARRDGDQLCFNGLVARPDGSEVHRISEKQNIALDDLKAAEDMGRKAGEALKVHVTDDFYDVD